jgi:hypothetical protein
LSANHERHVILRAPLQHDAARIDESIETAVQQAMRSQRRGVAYKAEE